MALTADQLANDDRLIGDNPLRFLLYLPLGLLLMCIRFVLGLTLWVFCIILPKRHSVRQILTTAACCTFGVYMKQKGERDPRVSVLIANYVSALDSLPAANLFETICLRKWKVPPFFASALGVQSVAQFARKQVCPGSGAPAGGGGSGSGQPVLLQPEGGPTNGRGLLPFTQLPLPLPQAVQPLAISVTRPLTAAHVHGGGGGGGAGAGLPWGELLWAMWSPHTAYTLHALPPLQRAPHETDAQLAERARRAIAHALQVELVDASWEQVEASVAGAAAGAARVRPGPSRAGATGTGVGGGAGAAGLGALAATVKEVLPLVPMQDIMRDLARTRSVDATIANFLEGATPYTAEEVEVGQAGAGVAGAAAGAASAAPEVRAAGAAPATWARCGRARQLGFAERKAQLVAQARRRYIEKHNLDLDLA